MTLTLHYRADLKALLDNAAIDADRDIIKEHYDRYADYLENHGITVDRDSTQTTYCWSGDEQPEPDFWNWFDDNS